MASQMINLPVLLATEKLQVNKANFPTFKVLIEEHAASKGLSGYLDGTIQKPPLITTPSDATAPEPTPIFSRAPSREEYLYRDGVMKSMVVTNIVDPIGLGVKRDGTAKECWDSVANACAKKSDAALSLAESEFLAIKFTGASRDALDLLLSDIRSKANRVRMMGGTAEDKQMKNVLIRSLPDDPRWLGLQGALYGASDLDEAFALIKTVAINSGMPEHDTAVTTTAALNTFAPKRRCTNPGCKAVNKTSHTIENCYWPGGGKEGQFPPNFGRNRPQAKQAGAEETPVYRVLMATARQVTVEEVEDEDLISRVVFPHYAPPVVDEHSNDIFKRILESEITSNAFVSRTFENFTPNTAVTFLDSGASDHFFRDRADFRSYEAVAVRTGKSALASDGDFAIVGKGTVTKTYIVDGKELRQDQK